MVPDCARWHEVAPDPAWSAQSLSPDCTISCEAGHTQCEHVERCQSRTICEYHAMGRNSLLSVDGQVLGEMPLGCRPRCFRGLTKLGAAAR